MDCVSAIDSSLQNNSKVGSSEEILRMEELLYSYSIKSNLIEKDLADFITMKF